MITTVQAREAFGAELKALRKARNWTLRGLEDLTGVTYTMICSIENCERTCSAALATKFADAFELSGNERERFLISAARTRRKDRLVEYARNLAPEIINFVPRTLANQGVKLDRIDSCDVITGAETERPKLAAKMTTAFEKLAQQLNRDNGGNYLVINADGKKYVCALLITTT